jgi:peptidoglycan hydrolase CwlO-like protein
MSDNMPNLDLGRKRLSVHITEMKLQLERFDLRKMEIQEELRKIEENINSTNLDIHNTQESIDKLGK